MRFVPVKSVGQEAALAVHSTRALLVRQRTMAANALRAALTELGIVAAKGFEGLRELMAGLEKPSAVVAGKIDIEVRLGRRTCRAITDYLLPGSFHGSSPPDAATYVFTSPLCDGLFPHLWEIHLTIAANPGRGA
jgi:hypothetical protein